MDETEKWRIATVALDAVGERYDYALAGSMALRAHGIIDRPVDDIDLFNQPDIGSDAIQARAEVIAALTDAGYEVAVERVFGMDQAANLAVRTPTGEAVTVQMVPMEMAYLPEQIDGLRVMSVQDCVQMKAEAIAWRTEAKDYIDLSDMNVHLGAPFVDECLAASPSPLNEVVFRSQLGKVAEIPDETFAAYGTDSYKAAEVRRNVLAWADDVATSKPDPLAVRATGPASGIEPLVQDQAERAADRIAANSPQSLMSDNELMVTAAKAKQLASAADKVAVETEREAGWLRHQFEETGGGSLAAALRDMNADDEVVRRAVTSEREDVERLASRAVEARGQARELREQEGTVRGEVQRRAGLTPGERAAETVIRREIQGQVAAQADPTRASVVARATAATAHQQQAAARA
ncbi:nucleotidyl transferase AbiEii/AbiGii toxin family protein [Streptomyces sp. NPDC057638]|uniref:nucleotidyl transferase AbiEii/AbiGii toxin family protein n=1 Tax=Streptomyces sp. NPDC057638 TaxID=3346190 RepID=UPI0036CCFC03